MRESFVVHAEYVEDLPEEYRKDYLWYCYNYGINNIEPTLTGFEQVVWIKIKRRIDADSAAYEESVNKKKLYNAKNHLRQGRISLEEKQLLEENGIVADLADLAVAKNFGSFGKSPPYTNTNTDTNTRGVYVSDIDTVSVSDTDIVSDTVIDNVSVSECVSVSVSEEATPHATHTNPAYAKEIYKIWTEANLPCAKNEIAFIQRDFTNALQYVKGIHSDAVIQACKNYVKELNDPDSFISQKMTFDAFVKSKIFQRMEPDYYSPDNNKKFESVDKDKKEPDPDTPEYWGRKRVPPPDSDWMVDLSDMPSKEEWDKMQEEKRKNGILTELTPPNYSTISTASNG